MKALKVSPNGESAAVEADVVVINVHAGTEEEVTAKADDAPVQVVEATNPKAAIVPRADVQAVIAVVVAAEAIVVAMIEALAKTDDVEVNAMTAGLATSGHPCMS